MKGASGALIKNSTGEILIVEPVYRKDWLLPGGVIEKGESPKEACQRECKEELSLTVHVGQLLCLEYRRATKNNPETTRFIFGCNVLEGEIKLREEELASYQFIPLKNALGLVDTSTARRLQRIQTNKHIYFET